MSAIRKMTVVTGAQCCKCHERIEVGEFYSREKSMYWHAACPPVDKNYIAAEYATANRHVAEERLNGSHTQGDALAAYAASQSAGYQTFGPLAVDDSFRAWEEEFEAEG